ncbi:MAG TPA: tRNA pseudouridine(55) synthase TruB [Pyrinomonadaceae bacterium]
MDGILIIDKPAGLTSHDVVARVRRILNIKRVGHTGTLDPFATGVLVILLGRATRLAQFLSGAEKEYAAEIRFGYATDTGDSTGERREPAATLKEGPGTWSDEEIEAALGALRGPIDQVPPMYSAKKVQGKKLYELARRGVEVERAAVAVTIHELETVRRDGVLLRPNRDGTVDLCVRVVCSAGTYVRTLAESIGERLGTAAHLSALRRTRAGDFSLENSVGLDALRAQAEAGEPGRERFLSMDAALPSLPFVHLTADEARRALHGVGLNVEARAAAGWPDGAQVRMRDEDGRLIAVGTYDAPGARLNPRVVLADAK